MSGNDHHDGNNGIPVDFGQLLNQSQLPYATWLEDAQREVMIKALEHVAKEGFPGEHHFYITYRTDYPGAILPDWLRARYPENITIVLQRQFSELKVVRQKNGQDYFSVLLSFNGQPTHLTIPFKAVAVFTDPAVPLELPFSVTVPYPEDMFEAEEEESTAEEATESRTAEVVQLDRFRRNQPPSPPPSGGESA